MSGRQAALTLYSLGRNQSRDSWQKYLIVRLSLWLGPLFTSDKGEKDDTSKRYMDVMHKKQMSVKMWRKTFCACYENRKYKPAHHHFWKNKVKLFLACFKIQIILKNCITSQDCGEVFFGIKRNYVCLDKSKINKPTSQNKEKVFICLSPCLFLLI